MKQNGSLNFNSAFDQTSQKLRDSLIKAAEDLGYIPEESLLLKCHELFEILSSNMICYITGPPGSGKTTIWKTLASALLCLGQKVLSKVVYTQSLSVNEFSEQLTNDKEWSNPGLSTQTVDHIQSQDDESVKWIVLDGEMKPEYEDILGRIEDGTIISQQKRFLIEMTDLQHVTVANMTKRGILSLKEDDVCWKSYLKAWLTDNCQRYNQSGKSKPLLFDENTKSILKQCFDQHYSRIQESLHLYQYIVPLNQIAIIQTICCLIESLLEEHCTMILNLNSQQQKIVYEGIYLYAVKWSLGGSLSGETENINYCKFDKMWRENSLIRYPEKGWCLDYYFDIHQMTWMNWSTRIQDLKPDIKAQVYREFYVPTTQTAKSQSLLAHSVQQRKPFLLAGSVGVGKTVLVKSYLASLNCQQYSSTSMNFNALMDSQVLRKKIQSAIARKNTTTAVNHQVLYFIDDLSLSTTESSYIHSSYALIREIIETNKAENSFQGDLTFVTCCNPQLRSLMTDQRLLRHFSTFAMNPPTEATIRAIYSQILSSHLPQATQSVQELIRKLIDATLIVFKGLKDDPICSSSLKKFSYQFSLKEFSQVIQGLMMMNSEVYYHGKNLLPKMCKLWVHECQRTFEDKLTVTKAILQFNKCLQDGYNHLIHETLDSSIFFTSFISEYYGTDKAYLPADDLSELKSIVEEKLIEYNTVKPRMNLIFFDSTINHIVRICRILSMPGGHGLLVGVPGSGRQSLAKLSAFILNIAVHEMAYTPDELTGEKFKTFLKDTIKTILIQPTKQRVLLIPDLHLHDDSNLMFVNNLLTSGSITDLFEENETGKTVSRDPHSGHHEISEKLLADQIKRNLHILIMVPSLGPELKSTAKNFPEIVKSTMIVWFHEWTRNALIELGEKFLDESEVPTKEACQAIETYMTEYERPLDTVQCIFAKQDLKSQTQSLRPFTHFLDVYLPTLGLQNAAPQFYLHENGLQTVSEVKQQIQALQQDFYNKVKLREMQTKQMVNLNNAIIQGSEKIKAETKKIQSIRKNLTPLLELLALEKEELQPILKRSLPIREQQRQDLNQIQKMELYELRAFKQPPGGVVEVGHAIVLLMSDYRVIQNEKIDNRYEQFIKVIGDYRFLEQMRNLEIENIPEHKIMKVKNIIETFGTDRFTYDFMLRKSIGIAKLAKWVTQTLEFYDQYVPHQLRISRFLEMSRKADSMQAQISASEDRVQKEKLWILDANKKIEEAKIKQQVAEQDVANAKARLEEVEKLALGFSLIRFGEIC